MQTAKMSEGGRVVVPVEIRKALNIKDGDTVYWDMKDGEVRLTTKLARMRRAQELVLKYCPARPGESVVDEFIAERRGEAARE